MDVDFRATGPERGSGNLQIWYTKNGKHSVGTASIYTAGRFDGLGIVIDQYAGSVCGCPEVVFTANTCRVDSFEDF